MVIGAFASLILLGTFLLSLDICQSGRAVGLLDCFFIATSAVCVTGLITVDTATTWSPLGQGLVLVLIQLGGLGIMTFSVALLHLAGRRPSPRSHMALRGALGPIAAHDMGRLTKHVILYTIVLETAGALVLFMRWVGDFGPSKAVALAVFHSVSAFCNAGFSLFTDNLQSYVGDATVNITIMALVTLGGLGFLVLRELWAHAPWRKGPRPRRLSLTARLVVTTSLILLVVGALSVAGFEYLANGGAVWRGSLWGPLFTAVTPRTAGFNTIPLGDLSNASLLIVMMLMLVGASPGSTGGGIKTTTVAVLVAMARTRLRGRPGAEAAGRRIHDEQVSGALALILGSLAVVVVATLILVSLNLPQEALGHRRGEFLAMTFEALSAFSTVGLSMGVTPHLPPVGKLTIIALMFIGRLGPLTFMYALTRDAVESRYQLGRERVMLG